MLQSLKSLWQAKVALILFLILATLWIAVQLPLSQHDLFDQIFGSTYGLLAVWGGIWGLLIARKWGFLKSVMGKALIFFSLGLLAQEFGQLAYFYYVFFLHIDVPYPSIGDLGYFGSIPLYIIGTLYLAKASGSHIGLREFTKKIQAIIIPLLLLALGYFLFLKDYTFDLTQPLTVFLDFGYPLGEALYISVAIMTYLLSRGVLGGMMRSKILFILFALVVQFLSDYMFLYQTSRGTWQAGGFNELFYLSSYFLMTFGLIQFITVYNTLRHK